MRNKSGRRPLEEEVLTPCLACVPSGSPSPTKKPAPKSVTKLAAQGTKAQVQEPIGQSAWNSTACSPHVSTGGQWTQLWSAGHYHQRVRAQGGEETPAPPTLAPGRPQSALPQ